MSNVYTLHALHGMKNELKKSFL